MTTETKTEAKFELPENANLKDVIKFVNEMATKIPAKRDRGPDSQRDMTEADAIRVVRGDLKGKKHNEAAEELGLSYGQVYSARFGHTFKKIAKETPWKDPSK